MAGSSQEQSNDGASAPGASASDGSADAVADDAPEAFAQSTSTVAADGSAGGTTVSIAVYRSSFPIVDWDLNDDDASLTKADWAWTGDLPERGTPGAAVEWEAPAGYAEPTRAGFEFAGWSTDASAPAGGYLDGSDPALSMPEGAPEGGEYRLFALWTPIEYSVVFDLSKNPDLGEGPLDQELLDLAWESDQQAGRTVTPLGEGRYRVDGFTMREDGYDPVARTVKLPVPTRGGYWHVGWAEPEGQSIAIDASDGWALNPVRLTQVDGTPVLTARWATGFGVTAPISITFGDYDKTGSPENPSQGASGSSAADDTTQSEADDVETPGLTDQERYEGAGQAYFENTSWHDAVKMVALESERDANANQVLTTYDSKRATEAAVLGDGTEENPGERLLSLYPSATPGDASTGVHFRLDDALAEADLASFATLGERGTPSARLDVSYGLNLATDPVTGAANHGLVLDTDDYDRKPIARVSYAFAVADAITEEPLPSPLYIEDGGIVYDLKYIKRAAEDISANGTSSKYYGQFKGYLDAQVVIEGRPGSGPYFKALIDGVYWDLQLIGICQDTKSDGSGKAGLTFQLRDIFSADSNIRYPGNGPYLSYISEKNDNRGGWQSSAQRELLRTTFYGYLDPALRLAIEPVDKFQQMPGGPTAESLQKTAGETIWLLSMYEVFGTSFEGYNESESLTDVTGYAPFQYMAFVGNNGGTRNAKAYKRYYSDSATSTAERWWLRSAYREDTTNFCWVSSAGARYLAGANTARGVVPAFCL